MAKSTDPTDYYANWAEAAGTITLLLADIPNLSSADAQATSGDIREILFRMLEQAHTVYDALAEADKLDKMVVTKNERVDADTEERITTYSITLRTEPSSGVSVAAE